MPSLSSPRRNGFSSRGVLGRLLFAGGLGAFGIQNVIFGDFIPGRAPAWPAELQGRLTFSWLTGLVFITTGALLLTEKGNYARWAAVVAGTLVLGWALVRHVPVVMGDVFIGGSWTAAGKAVVVLGGLCALTARYPTQHRDGLVWAGRISLGAFMILCGFQHFKWDDFVVTLVPAWMPGGGAFWTYVTGVLLIVGGAGMVIPRTMHLAAALSGLMILLWVPLVHLPLAFAAGDTMASKGSWAAVVEATVFSGLAFYLASCGSGRTASSSTERSA